MEFFCEEFYLKVAIKGFIIYDSLINQSLN